MTATDRPLAIVIPPDGGNGYWQPVPANGYSEVCIAGENVPGNDRFSMGVQVVAPGSHVKPHTHAEHEELLFFWQGKGRVVVDGVEHPIVPGTTAYVGPGCLHTFINDGEEDLKLTWFILPGGLESYFAGIGRPRTPGEAAPANFPRPEDAQAIQDRAGFGKVPEPAG